MRCSQYSGSDDFCAMMFDIGGLRRRCVRRRDGARGRVELSFCFANVMLGLIISFMSSQALLTIQHSHALLQFSMSHQSSDCSPLKQPLVMKRKRRSSICKSSTLLCTVLACGGALPKTAVAFQCPTSSTQRRQHNSRSIQTSVSLGSSINGLATHEDHHSTSLFNVGYDANAIINFYDQRPWEVGLRLNMLGLPLLGECLDDVSVATTTANHSNKSFVLFIHTGWYLGLVTDRILKINDKESVERKRGEELRMHLVRSKSVALIKSGQALSLRPDLLKSKIWADELGKLVDEVGSFPDYEAMNIMRDELSDLLPKVKNAKKVEQTNKTPGAKKGKMNKVDRLVESDPVLCMFEFYNDCRVVASASIGQVYKARIRRGPALEAAIGKAEAAKWGGRTVAIKVQRPDVAASASLDMYLIRRTAMWLSKFRGGDIVAIADTFGLQLFGELDYVREANNCERFRGLYGDWDDVVVPPACISLTRKKVLVMDWVEGEKGPWKGSEGIDMVRIGLRCSTDQLLRTG